VISDGGSYGGVGGAGFHGGGGGGTSVEISGYNYVGGDHRVVNGGLAGGGLPGERGRTGTELGSINRSHGGAGATLSTGNYGSPLVVSEGIVSSGAGGEVVGGESVAGGGGGAKGIIPIVSGLTPVQVAEAGQDVADGGYDAFTGYGGAPGVGFGA